MDSVTNAAIDNSKEQILNILNLNQATASMFYVMRKKNESSEEFYFRIYTTLDAEGMAIPTEALIALYTKGKATRDLKNLIVNTASLREETFMLGDYTYEWDDSTKSSVKKIRYYRHKEHVLFYPEYDALSSTTIRKSTVLPVMSDRPLSFVKGRAVSRDGKIISAISAPLSPWLP